MYLPNFYCDIDAINNLIQMDYPVEHQTVDISIDLIELPLWFVFTSTDSDWVIRAYQRMDFFVHEESSTFSAGEIIINKASQTASSNLETKINENIIPFFNAFRNLSCYAHDHGWETKFSDLHPDKSGIVISFTDHELTYSVVNGNDIPEVMCITLRGETVMCNPLFDAFMQRSMNDLLPIDEKIKVAENGDEDMMEQLAYIYSDGDDDVDPDPEKAVYWFSRLAELEHSEAQFNLGLHYAKGHGVTRDFSKAIYWLEKAAENGDMDAPSTIDSLKKAMEAEPLAASGNAQAQADLASAYMFLGGSLAQAGPLQDYELAFDLAQKSAAQNNGDGIWYLALAYEHGRGTTIDIDKAIQLYRQGAKIGHAPSQHSLGVYYYNGEYLEQDLEKAFELFMASAQQGYGLAMKNVGQCYQFSIGVPYCNMNKAMEWYEKALTVLDDPELEHTVSLYKELMGSEDWEDEDDFGEEEDE